MSFVRSLLALASAASAIFTAYAFGHGLSNHHTMPFILSGVFLVVTALLVLLQVRFGRGEAGGH